MEKRSKNLYKKAMAYYEQGKINPFSKSTNENYNNSNINNNSNSSVGNTQETETQGGKLLNTVK